MGRLYIAGLGLWNENDMTVRTRGILRNCAKVYMEEYTSKLMGTNPKRLFEAIGRPIVALNRKDVEEGDSFLKAAAEGDVALLCGGDPAFATTHNEIAMRAREMGIEVRWLHAPSIFSAVSALTGLSPYKFGRTTTLVFPEGEYLPESPLEFMGENQKMGLHTLILMDIEYEEEPPRYMTVHEALDIIEALEDMTRLAVVKEDTILCGIARAGSDDAVVKAGTIAELRKVEFGPPLHAMALPGILHFMEERALEHIRAGRT